MNLSMDNLVRVYENVLDKDTCVKLIEKFEAHTEHQEKMQDNKMSFTQIDFRKNMSGWKIEMANLIDICFPYITKYKEEFDPIWPERHAFESFKIKRYMPDGIDEFPRHVDVSSYENARRFLVFFLYLNDNEAGETMVDNVVSKCKQGNMLVFPPMWTHPHSGEKPTKKPKYIVGSYLHYT